MVLKSILKVSVNDIFEYPMVVANIIKHITKREPNSIGITVFPLFTSSPKGEISLIVFQDLQ